MTSNELTQEVDAGFVVDEAIKKAWVASQQKRLHLSEQETVHEFRAYAVMGNAAMMAETASRLRDIRKVIQWLQSY